MATVAAVAPLDHRSGPPDVGEHGREATRALSTAPAIDERAVVFPLGQKVRLELGRDVFRDECRPDFTCVKGRDLLVDRADADTLFVSEDREIDRPGEVVFAELHGRAHVDDLIKERCDGEREMDSFDETTHVCNLDSLPWATEREHRPYMDEGTEMRNDLSQILTENVLG